MEAMWDTSAIDLRWQHYFLYVCEDFRTQKFISPTDLPLLFSLTTILGPLEVTLG